MVFILFLGIVGGFLSGFLGISSGIVITPSLLSIGIPPLTAISSQLNNVVATDIIGFLEYKRKDAVDLPLSFYLFLGGVIGAWNEISILNYLTQKNLIDVYTQNLPWVYAILLFVLGVLSLKTAHTQRLLYGIIAMHSWMHWIPIHKVFIRSRAEISIPLIIGIGWITGFLTATLGGGNSLILIPVLTYIIGRVSHSTTGTSFLAGLGITMAVILFHSPHASFDPKISCLLIVGTAMGTPLGVSVSTRYTKKTLMIARSIVIFLLCFRSIINIFIQELPKAPVKETKGFLYTFLGAIGSMLLALVLDKTVSPWIRKFAK